MKKRTISIRWLIGLLFFALLLPLTLLLCVSTVTQSVEMQNAAAQAKWNNLHIIAGRLNDETALVESSISDLVLNDTTFHELNGYLNDVERYSHLHDVQAAFERLFRQSDNLTALTVYFDASDELFQKDMGLAYMTTAQRIQFRAALKTYYRGACADGTIEEGNWFLVPLEGRWLLARSVETFGVHCACFYDLEEMIKRQQAYFEEGDALALQADGRYFTAGPAQDFAQIRAFWQEEDGKEWENQPVGLVAHETLNGFAFICVSPSQQFGQGANDYVWMMVAFSFVMLFLLPVVYWLLSQRLFHPLGRLMKTMDKIAEGDLNTTANDPQAGRELQMTNATFNQMLGRIRALKIESYERELEKKQTQLQYYRAQIRPHFYLNCLKNIYSLAERREFANIEQSILYLSGYLRYTFQDNADTVELQEELRQCENYIDLMGVSAVYPPRMELDVDAESIATHVPPVSILTIVENSIRYFPINIRQMTVRVSTRLLRTDEAEYLEVSVRDNGPGFPEQVLEKLNSADWRRQEGHVGLSNVVSRCRLLYGEKFSIAFSNDGGAVVDLYLPLEGKEGDRQ